MGWENDLDRWLTTPPEPPEPRINGKCALCGDALLETEEVFKCDDTGELLCSDVCAKGWLVQEWLEYFTTTEVPLIEEEDDGWWS